MKISNEDKEQNTLLERFGDNPEAVWAVIRILESFLSDAFNESIEIIHIEKTSYDDYNYDIQLAYLAEIRYDGKNNKDNRGYITFKADIFKNQGVVQDFEILQIHGKNFWDPPRGPVEANTRIQNQINRISEILP